MRQSQVRESLLKGEQHLHARVDTWIQVLWFLSHCPHGPYSNPSDLLLPKARDVGIAVGKGMSHPPFHLYSVSWAYRALLWRWRENSLPSLPKDSHSRNWAKKTSFLRFTLWALLLYCSFTHPKSQPVQQDLGSGVWVPNYCWIRLPSSSAPDT